MIRSHRPPLVLLAEDDPDDRLLLNEAFVEAGVDVQLETVPDGEALLDFLHHRGEYANRDVDERPGLILCDINMPRLSGIEAVEALRHSEEFSGVHIVMLTSSRREEDQRRSRAAGADAHFVKPSSFGELVRLIHDVVTRYVDVDRPPDVTPR